jgi:hypothetical protein
VDKPIRWWQAQAALVPDGACPKCQGATRGEYVVDTSGEHRYKKTYRAVVERCRTCGWLHAVRTQEQSGPIETNTTPRNLRPIGAELEQDEQEEREDRRGRRIVGVARLPIAARRKR